MTRYIIYVCVVSHDQAEFCKWIDIIQKGCTFVDGIQLTQRIRVVHDIFVVYQCNMIVPAWQPDGFFGEIPGWLCDMAAIIAAPSNQTYDHNENHQTLQWDHHQWS